MSQHSTHSAGSSRPAAQVEPPASSQRGSTSPQHSRSGPRRPRVVCLAAQLAVAACGIAVASAATAPTANSTITTPSYDQTTNAHDSMSRTVALGFGTADLGGSYAASPVDKFSVSAGAGHIASIASGTHASATLSLAGPVDEELQSTFSLPAVPVSGVGVYYEHEFRRQANGDAYRVQIRVAPKGQMTLGFAQMRNNVETALGGQLVVPQLATAGRTIVLQGLVAGSTTVQLQARAWLAGTTIPAWQLAATDSASSRLTAAGQIGVYVYTSSNTKAAKLTVAGLQGWSLTLAAPTASPTTSSTSTLSSPTSSTSIASSTTSSTSTSSTTSTATSPSSSPSPTSTTSAPTSTNPPPQGGYFGLQPAGAWDTLPTDAACTAQVHYSTWEPRPDNAGPNSRMPDPSAVHSSFAARPVNTGGSYDPRWDSWLLQRVDGQFAGTTDEAFQWAACKWGLSDDMLRAIAVRESTWYQYEVYPSGRPVSNRGSGDIMPAGTVGADVYCNGIAAYGRDYQLDYGTNICPKTFSIAGVMSWEAPSWGQMPGNQNGTFPFNRDSTAFALDYLAGHLRGCYNGWELWLSHSGTYAAGDIWGCVGAWYAGDWHSAAADGYISRVQTELANFTWLQAGWPSDKPSCDPTYGCPGPDPLP